MVLENILSAEKAESSPFRMVFLGFLFVAVGSFLGFQVFKKYSSLLSVFLSAMAAIPLMIKIIKMEEEKDLEGKKELWLLKEHSKALLSFFWLFIGMTLAFTAIYLLVPSSTLNVLFEAQTNTITSINSGVTSFSTASFQHFTDIFMNNLLVLFFCALFSLLYGAGAIFILSWNASIIGVAIGDFIRSGLTTYSHLLGLEKIAQYFQVVGVGLLKYVIHGVPEILAYFVAGLAGGIISKAVVNHDFGTKDFEKVLLDSADLLLLSFVLLLLASVFEVWLTPLVFS